MSEDKKTVVKMAYIYSQEGRWDKAVAEYKKLLKLDPEDFNAQNMLGDVYVKKGEPQPAYESYMIAAEAYNRLGQMEKATVVYRKIAKLDASQLSPDAKKKQAVFQKQVEGETAMENNELDQAVEAFKAVLQLDAERFDIYQRLGDLYLRKGQSDQAVKQYNEIADIYFKNKLYKKAAPVYKKIIELDPANVEAHAAMGEIHARSGNESDAKKEYLLIAEAMLAKGDLDTALAYSKKAVQLKSIEAYYYLGQVLLKQGKHEEAKAEFDKLLKFKLNHTGALVSMGRIQEAKGSADEALKFYQRALKVEKNNLEALLCAALIYESKGDKAQASQHYNEASATATALGDAVKAAEYASKAQVLSPGAPPPPPPLPPPAPPAPVMEAPAPAPAPLPAPQAEPEMETAPVLAASAPAPPLPQFEALPEAPVQAHDPAEERATLLNLAQNYADEGSLDEAIELYQRILSTAPDDKQAKDALTQIYARLARNAAPSPQELAQKKAEEDARLAAEAAAKAEDAARKKAEEDAARARAEDADMARQAAEAAARLQELRRQAEEEQRRLEEMRAAQEAAHRKLEEDARRNREEEEARRNKAAEEAHLKEEAERAKLNEVEMRKRLEAEIRQQLEEEMRRKFEDEARAKAEESLRLKMLEEQKKADEEARKRAQEETTRRMDEERKKLEQEKAEVRRRMEEEMRKSIEAQERAKSEREAMEKVEAFRKKEEQESKLKIQQEVLARVQAQQRDMQRVNQKAIDEIRKKVEADQASKHAAKEPQAGSPAPKTEAPKPAADAAAFDDMDDFMTEAVADIYTKQGLTDQARGIYEKILAREPGNAGVRKKLDKLNGVVTPPAPVPAAAQAPAAGKAAAPAPAAKDAAPEAAKAKKSKVSYL